MEMYNENELNELQVDFETFVVDEEFYTESLITHVFMDLIKYVTDKDLEDRITNLTEFNTESEEFFNLMKDFCLHIYSRIPEEHRDEVLGKMNYADFNLFYQTIKETDPKMYWYFFEKNKNNHDVNINEVDAINALKELPKLLQNKLPYEVYFSSKFFLDKLGKQTKKELFPDMLLNILNEEPENKKIPRLFLLDSIIKYTPMQDENDEIKMAIDKIMELDFSKLGIDSKVVINLLMSMRVKNASELVTETFLAKFDELDETKLGTGKLEILGDIQKRIPEKSKQNETIKEKIKEYIINNPDIPGTEIYKYKDILGMDFCYSFLSKQDLELIVFRNAKTFNDPDFLQYFIERSLADSLEPINKDEFIAHLYQTIQMDEIFFPEIPENEFVDKVVKPFAVAIINEQNKESVSDMTQYYEYISTGAQMEENLFDQFMNDLAKNRTLGEDIPEECCDYILLQTLIPDSPLVNNIYTYDFLVERVIEQKSMYILEEMGIQNYSVRVLEDIGNAEYAGSQSTRDIRYTRKYTSGLIDGYNFYHIDTMNHECRHACQGIQFRTGTDYKILQENLLRASRGNEYYKENYKYETSENDANIFGLAVSYSMNKSVNKNLAVKKDLNESQTKKDLKKLSAYQGRDTLRKVDGSRKDFLGNIFAQEVKKNPGWITEYPILRIGFNQDGNRRPSLEILEEFDEKVKQSIENHQLSKRSALSIYSAFLKERVQLPPETIFSDIGLLFDFKSDLKIVNKHRDFIIRNEILPAIFEWGENGEVPFSGDDQDYKKSSFEVAVELMKRFALAHQEDEISEEIMEIIRPHIISSKENVQSEVEKMRMISDSVNIVEYNEGTEALIKIAEEQKDKNKNLENTGNERDEF